MVLRGNKNGYYANKGFESHICGMASKSVTKRLMLSVLAAVVLIAGATPFAAKAADLESTWAIKYTLKFGEPVQKSEIRMGLFVEDREQAELEGMGLLELRITPARGIHYAVLDKETTQGPLNWMKTQYASVKGKLRLQDWKDALKGF